MSSNRLAFIKLIMHQYRETHCNKTFVWVRALIHRLAELTGQETLPPQENYMSHLARGFEYNGNSY